MKETTLSTEYVLTTVGNNGMTHTATYSDLKEATRDLNSIVRKFRSYYDNGACGGDLGDLGTKEGLDAFIEANFYIEKVTVKSKRVKSAPAREGFEKRAEERVAEVAANRSERDGELSELIQNNLDYEATGSVYQLEQYASTLRRYNDYEHAREVSAERDELLKRLSETHVVLRYFDGRDLRWLVFPSSFKCEGVEVTCYRRTETWLSRSNAKEFYATGAMCCDGSERDRYLNVYMQLDAGLDKCSDMWS